LSTGLQHDVFVACLAVATAFTINKDFRIFVNPSPFAVSITKRAIISLLQPLNQDRTPAGIFSWWRRKPDNTSLPVNP